MCWFSPGFRQFKMQLIIPLEHSHFDYFTLFQALQCRVLFCLAPSCHANCPHYGIVECVTDFFSFGGVDYTHSLSLQWLVSDASIVVSHIRAKQTAPCQLLPSVCGHVSLWRQRGRGMFTLCISQ